MKNGMIVFLLLLAAGAVLIGCKRRPGGPGAPEPETIPLGGDALPFESFRFSVQGMSAEAEVVEGIRQEDGSLTLSYYLHRSYYDGEEAVDQKNVIREITGDKAFYDEIAALFGYYNVRKWDGFDGPNPPGVLDGESGSFDAKLSDGTTISAYGSNNFPDHFFTVMRDLQDRLQTETISGTHLEFRGFSVDIPESWIGVMNLFYGAEYVAFETEIDGSRTSTLLIDDGSYGYTDYSTGFRAGRLEKEGEAPRYLTVREVNRMESFGEKLSEAQKAVSAGFDDARAQITESITGVNGWTFVPETGDTLYEADARNLFERARSLWLDLCLAGEYAGSAVPETIDGRKYRVTFAPYTGIRVRNEEELRAELENVFSKEFTEAFLASRLQKKDLLFRENVLYSAFYKSADPMRYGSSWVDGFSNDAIVIKIRKALPTDEEYRYSGEETISFPVTRNEEGIFVFSDFPYWVEGIE